MNKKNHTTFIFKMWSWFFCLFSLFLSSNGSSSLQSVTLHSQELTAETVCILLHFQVEPRFTKDAVSFSSPTTWLKTSSRPESFSKHSAEKLQCGYLLQTCRGFLLNEDGKGCGQNIDPRVIFVTENKPWQIWSYKCPHTHIYTHTHSQGQMQKPFTSV